jgi:AraC-like DNA-binding protein
MRHLERKFIQQVGLSPKLLTRIARFQATLETKARFVSKSWTDVAHESGYYDQMHMVHDFAEFMGTSPTVALTQLETVFLEQIERLRSDERSANSVGRSRLIL